MPQSNYWDKRFLLLNEMLLQQGEEYIKSSTKNYIAVMAEIEKEINNFFERFANENNMTYQQAKQVLTTQERQAFQMELQDYIAYGQQNNLDDVWIKKLENASTVHRITRLQAIQYQLQQQVEKLQAQKIKGITETLKNIYKEGYYRTAYEIQKGTGIGQAFSKIDENKIEKVLAKPWAADGKNFSERVWGTDRTNLIYQLETRFTQGIIRGEAPQKIIRDISKTLDVSQKATRRLVLTESAFVASASRRDMFERLDVKQYKILSTLDLKTSELCREMDGKIFDLKDYKIGVTASPFHPHCRTTEIPNIDDKFTQNQQRAARNKEGKTYYVPYDMTYEQWHKTYVENDPEWLLQEKKLKNKSTDKKQYEQYKAVLGKKEIGSFDNFQNIKYTDSEKWDSLKKSKDSIKRIENANKTFDEFLLNISSTPFTENMRFYNETTERRLNKKLNSPFAYNSNLDVMEYNPFAPNFEKYDMNYVQCHELSHRMDELQYRSWENDKFLKAVENTRQTIYNNANKIEKWFDIDGEYEKDIALSDIFSALSKGSLNDILYSGHSISYWLKDETRISKEIFANIASIDVLKYESKKELINKEGILNELYQVYKELI